MSTQNLDVVKKLNTAKQQLHQAVHGFLEAFDQLHDEATMFVAGKADLVAAGAPQPDAGAPVQRRGDTPAVVEPVANPEPAPVPEVSFEKLREAAAAKANAGHTAEVRDLLAKYKVGKLSDLDPQARAAFYEELGLIR